MLLSLSLSLLFLIFLINAVFADYEKVCEKSFSSALLSLSNVPNPEKLCEELLNPEEQNS